MSAVPLEPRVPDWRAVRGTLRWSERRRVTKSVQRGTVIADDPRLARGAVALARWLQDVPQHSPNRTLWLLLLGLRYGYGWAVVAFDTLLLINLPTWRLFLMLGALTVAGLAVAGYFVRRAAVKAEARNTRVLTTTITKEG